MFGISAGQWGMPGTGSGPAPALYGHQRMGGTDKYLYNNKPVSKEELDAIYGNTSGGGATPEQAMFDPWGEHRGGFADRLAVEGKGTDPAVVFRNKLTSMMTGQFSPDDPSYKFRFDQGQQAVERSLASRGLLNSGNAAIELQQYGQAAASQEYGDQFDRLLQGMMGVEQQYGSQMDRLMELSGVNIGPGVLAGYMSNMAGINSENAYRSNMDKGIRDSMSGRGITKDPYAGYRFG